MTRVRTLGPSFQGGTNPSRRYPLLPFMLKQVLDVMNCDACLLQDLVVRTSHADKIQQESKGLKLDILAELAKLGFVCVSGDLSFKTTMHVVPKAL